MEAQTSRLAAYSYSHAKNVQRYTILSSLDKVKMPVSFFKWVFVEMRFLFGFLFFGQGNSLAAQLCTLRNLTEAQLTVVSFLTNFFLWFRAIHDQFWFTTLFSIGSFLIQNPHCHSQMCKVEHAPTTSFHRCWVKGNYWSYHLSHSQAAHQTW